MKHLSAFFGLFLLAVSSQAALPQPDLLMQIHFAGGKTISDDPHSKAFTNEFCSAEALALRTQTAGKLALWLGGWLQTNLNVTIPGAATKLRPLFDDLQSAEWFLEMRAAANNKVEVAIAVQLDAARSQLWQNALKPFFPSASFRSSGGWLIFDSDPSLLKMGEALALKVSSPPAGWLDLDVNWPRLAQWYPVLKTLALPETQFTVTAPDADFRINGKFLFPQNLTINLEPWRVPTNTLHQPFNSFTAVRGFAAWLQSQPWAQPYEIAPAPNECFDWSLPSLPFQTFAAVPVPDAADATAQMYARVASAFISINAGNYFIGPVTPNLSSNGVAFVGLPFIAPHLRALTEAAGQYLFWETIPNTPRSTPLPAELFRQLGTKGLVFYHWEITAERMPQLLQLSQLGLMISRHKQLDGRAVALKWLQKFDGMLGGMDTEITQSGPAELTFARKAAGIFTAAELYVLANWLEAENFPGCDLKLPPPPNLKRLHPQSTQTQVISIPAPAPGH